MENPCVPMFRSDMMTKYFIQKRLRGEKADFSSQFPVTVHGVEKPRQQELRQRVTSQPQSKAKGT